MAQATGIDFPVLYWACMDESNLAAAVVKQSLDSWQVSRHIHHQRATLDYPHDVIHLGIMVWSISDQSQLAVMASSLEIQRRNHPQIFQLVFLHRDLSEYNGLLIEAGANFVVNQLGQLQTVLLKMVDRLPVSHQGHHPLLSGLITRLPWSHLAT